MIAYIIWTEYFWRSGYKMHFGNVANTPFFAAFLSLVTIMMQATCMCQLLWAIHSYETGVCNFRKERTCLTREGETNH